MRGWVAQFLIMSLVGSFAYAQIFSDTELLNTNATTDSGDDSKPKIAADGHGNWMAVWNSDDTLGSTLGNDFDVLFAVSTDNGATWSEPAPVHANATSDTEEDLWPVVKARGQESWLVVWQSKTNFNGTIGTDTDIVFAYTSDNGDNWSTPDAVNSSATIDTTESEYLPQIETDGAGVWVAVYITNNDFVLYDNDGDLFFSRSTDNGMSWSAMTVLNSIADEDHVTNDDDNQHIATDGQGNWLVVWNQKIDFGLDFEIFSSTSTDNGLTWSNAINVNDAAGDLGHDNFASIATDGAGTWVCAWETEETSLGTGFDSDLYVARSIDIGATWSTPAPLNSNAATDSSFDIVPMVQSEGPNDWIVIWVQLSGGGGPTGADDDLLFSSSADGGLTWTDIAPLNTDAETDPSTHNDGGLAHIGGDGNGNRISVWEKQDSIGISHGLDSDLAFNRTVACVLPAAFLDTVATWNTIVTVLPLITIVNENCGP